MSKRIGKKKKVEPLFKHQMLITGILVFAIVVSVFGGSYALFSDTDSGDEYNVVTAGNMVLSYVDLSEEGNTLTLNNPYPVSDSIGSGGSSYRFSVENTGDIKTNYKVVITDDTDVIESDGCSNNLVDKSYIRYRLNSGDVGNFKDLYSADDEGYVIYSGSLNKGDSEIHEIRLWLKEASPNTVLGKHYHGKVNVILEQAEGLK